MNRQTVITAITLCGLALLFAGIGISVDVKNPYSGWSHFGVGMAFFGVIIFIFSIVLLAYYYPDPDFRRGASF